jgi:hypothetical protein
VDSETVNWSVFTIEKCARIQYYAKLSTLYLIVLNVLKIEKSEGSNLWAMAVRWNKMTEMDGIKSLIHWEKLYQLGQIDHPEKGKQICEPDRKFLLKTSKIENILLSFLLYHVRSK